MFFFGGGCNNANILLYRYKNLIKNSICIIILSIQGLSNLQYLHNEVVKIFDHIIVNIDDIDTINPVGRRDDMKTIHSEFHSNTKTFTNVAVTRVVRNNDDDDDENMDEDDDDSDDDDIAIIWSKKPNMRGIGSSISTSTSTTGTTSQLREEEDSSDETTTISSSTKAALFPFPPSIEQLNRFNKRRRKNETIISNNTHYTVDILSFGSMFALNKTNTQLQTWGSHINRRWFWTATENDDPNPNCYKDKTIDDVENQCSVCKRKNLRPGWKDNRLQHRFKNQYARFQWIQGKANPVGWLCAQQRVTYALSKLGRTYRNAMLSSSFSVNDVLPDYLIVADDDTYVNLEMFENRILKGSTSPPSSPTLNAKNNNNQTAVATDNHNNIEVPLVWSGCTLRAPVSTVNFTSPFGGFGTFYSKAALQRMIQPIYCNGNTSFLSSFESGVCDQLNVDLLSEKQYFQNGMSISDFMGSFSNQDPFCLHSDWAQGYFANFYNLSSHVNEEYFINTKEARLRSLDDSEFYYRGRNNCLNEGEKCDDKSHVCHYVSNEQMTRVHSTVSSNFPDKYVV